MFTTEFNKLNLAFEKLALLTSIEMEYFCPKVVEAWAF